jgi:hypothetical protein
MRSLKLDLAHVNAYLALKQRLLPTARGSDVTEVTRNMAALHATTPAGPFLSLWARMTAFARSLLEDALYDQRTLVRTICMRQTLHVVPSGELAQYIQAYAARYGASARAEGQTLLVQAGLCGEAEAANRWSDLQRRVLGVVSDTGPCTVRDLSRAIPELRSQVRYSVGKSYEGSFSVGSRLVPAMCTLGILVRSRPRGTWRSNLYEYALLSDWLPGIDLGATSTPEAQAWLVRRYLSALGPATVEDVQWWTGLTLGETTHALDALRPSLVEVSIAGLGTSLMQDGDLERCRDFSPPDRPYAWFLPSLDPYVMGYSDRRRFLDPGSQGAILDRARNAVPTVWLNGQIVGAWAQRRDGSVVYGVFEPHPSSARAVIDAEAGRLQAFLRGEYLALRSHTPFTRKLVS